MNRHYLPPNKAFAIPLNFALRIVNDSRSVVEGLLLADGRPARSTAADPLPTFDPGESATAVAR
jgi:hypothetical protein